ncbi:hypothetical protein D3C78_1405760 [compost metagenome]
MNSRHHRDLECGNLCQRTLAFFRQRFGFFGCGTGGNHGDIRTGNKRVRLAGNDHQPFQRWMLLRADQYVVDLFDKLGLQRIDLLAGDINGDHAYIIRTYRQLKG